MLSRVSLPKLLALFLFVTLYLVPLLVALFLGIAPALKTGAWLALWQDTQTIPALLRTLISALLSFFLALLLALWLAKHAYQSRYWRVLLAKLPAMLSFPHVAFAVGLVFLIAPSGYLLRLFSLFTVYSSAPDWSTVNDSYAISLALALALKEIPFLLWNIALLLSDDRYQQQYQVGLCLGYAPSRVWNRVIQPQLLLALRFPLFAVLAYALTVVDVAAVIGPDNPPTFALLVWQWISGGDPSYQAQAYSGMLLLALLSGALILLIFALLRWFLRVDSLLSNRRGHRSSNWPIKAGLSILFALYLFVGVLLLVWSFADSWRFPHLLPEHFSWFAWRGVLLGGAMFHTILFALASSSLAMLVGLFWLEWGARSHLWLWAIYLPLGLPPLLLVAGEYQFFLPLNLNGTAAAVVLAHLTWVLPYFLLVLRPAYVLYDDEYLLLARNLGCSHFVACLRVKWVMLSRQIAAAFAVSFAVSVAQYLPTAFIGAGRLPTLTTEAVAMSSGGLPQVLAANSICLACLPLLVFILAQMPSKKIAALMRICKRKTRQIKNFGGFR